VFIASTDGETRTGPSARGSATLSASEQVVVDFDPPARPVVMPKRDCTRSSPPSTRSRCSEQALEPIAMYDVPRLPPKGGLKPRTRAHRQGVPQVTALEADRRRLLSSKRTSSSRFSRRRDELLGSRAAGSSVADWSRRVTGDDEDNILICSGGQGEVPLRARESRASTTAHPALQALGIQPGGLGHDLILRPDRARGCPATGLVTCSASRRTPRDHRARGSGNRPGGRPNASATWHCRRQADSFRAAWKGRGSSRRRQGSVEAATRSCSCSIGPSRTQITPVLRGRTDRTGVQIGAAAAEAPGPGVWLGKREDSPAIWAAGARHARVDRAARRSRTAATRRSCVQRPPADHRGASTARCRGVRRSQHAATTTVRGRPCAQRWDARKARACSHIRRCGRCGPTCTRRRARRSRSSGEHGAITLPYPLLDGQATSTGRTTAGC